MRKALSLLLVLFVLALSSGCPSGPSLPPSTAGGGFFIQTLTSFNLAPPVIAPVTQVKGTWVKDQPGAQGNPSTFNLTTNSAGVGVSNNGRAPADWKFVWVFSLVAPCEGQSVTVTVHFVDDDVGLLCSVEVVGGVAQSATGNAMADFVFSPNPLVTDGSSGNEAFISGQGFSKQYGMPLLQYFDLNGNLVTQTNADGVAADGSWISAPVPDVSQLPLGAYVGFMSNANASGGYDLVGATSVQVTLPPPPPPPPDPCPTNPCMPQN
jgi:hypothetical protein